MFLRQYGVSCRKSLHDAAQRKSSPKSKQRTLSPSSPTRYSLRNRTNNEPSDVGDDSHSDKDISGNVEISSHLNSSSKCTEEHSHSHSSNFDQFENTHIEEHSRTSAEQSFPRPGDIPESLFYGQPHAFSRHREPTVETNSGLWKFLAALMASTAIVIYLVFGLSSQSIAPKQPISCPQFKELTKYFLHQDMLLWKSLRIGIENVLNENPAKPSVFLLAYSDIETTENLMAKILNATANCMQTKRPIQLNGATFATNEMVKDYGEIIAKYRDELKKEKILYVSDVNKTPAAAAQVFHTICDTVEPLVEKAVIFFTVYLEPDNYDPNPISLLHKVEQVLENNWHTDNAVSENTLKALIGRVTDQVFLLRSENVST